MINQPPELTYVALSAALTGLLWVPIVLNRFRELGVWGTLKTPERNMQAEAEWAYRLVNAHRNAVENFVVFAPLALVVHALGLASPATALACALYFWGRLAHAVAYALGVPILRTVAFLIGFAAEATLFLRIFGYV
ncbi:MAPEG family protein [Methylocystis sp. JAN1]|uniref:MAPEG family protein n=1 Tax=Methylocystis sp. JAN1 TaxID=3397211 RepID=UPI003FA32512